MPKPYLKLGKNIIIQYLTEFGVWQVSSIRQSPKLSTLALGRYLDG